MIVFTVFLFLLYTWFLASGYHIADIGNLLRETNKGTKNFTLLDSGYDATLEKEGKGVKVTMNSHADNGWIVLFYNDGYSKDVLKSPQGDKYVLSFNIKSNIEHTHIRVSHKEKNAKNNQIDFGDAYIENSNKWVHITLEGTLTGEDITAQGLYIDLRGNPAGTTISIRDLRLVHR